MPNYYRSNFHLNQINIAHLAKPHRTNYQSCCKPCRKSISSTSQELALQVFGLEGATHYGNGLVHQTTLNDLNLPQNITDGLDGDDAVNLTCSYDYANNITSITDDVDNSFSLTDLTYDGLDRLKTVTGSLSIGSSALTYDTFGRIESN